jgi:imidazolonepropionase-like amidohydrolase
MQNSCDLLIMNASAVIPKVGIINDTNIMIEDGKIKSLVSSPNNVSATRKIAGKQR